jgi:hypothetical protein
MNNRGLTLTVSFEGVLTRIDQMAPICGLDIMPATGAIALAAAVATRISYAR